MEQVDLDVFLAPSRCLATRSRTLIQLFFGRNKNFDCGPKSLGRLVDEGVV